MGGAVQMTYGKLGGRRRKTKDESLSRNNRFPPPFHPLRENEQKSKGRNPRTPQFFAEFSFRGSRVGGGNDILTVVGTTAVWWEGEEENFRGRKGQDTQVREQKKDSFSLLFDFSFAGEARKEGRKKIDRLFFVLRAEEELGGRKVCV